MFRTISTIIAGLLLIAVAGVMSVATSPTPSVGDDTVSIVDSETEDTGEIGEGIVEQAPMDEVDPEWPVNDELEPVDNDDVPGDGFDSNTEGDADGVTEYGFEVHEGDWPEDTELDVCD